MKDLYFRYLHTLGRRVYDKSMSTLCKSDPPFEFNQITDYLYLGTTPCCDAHAKSELFDEDIRSMISMELEKHCAPIGAFSWLWLPTVDNEAPDMDQLRLGIRTIDEPMRMGRKVYVHCRYGQGRGPTLVVAHFIKHGMTVDEAIAYVKKHRPVACPRVDQVKLLEEYRVYVQDKMSSRTAPHRVFPKTMKDRVTSWKKTFKTS